MLKVCRNNKTKVKEQINKKILDGIAISNSNLVDDINFINATSWCFRLFR